MHRRSAVEPSRGRVFPSRDRAVIAAAALAMLLVQLDWFALNLMLPVIARDFGEPTTDLQWLVSGYMLALGALMIVGGEWPTSMADGRSSSAA